VRYVRALAPVLLVGCFSKPAPPSDATSGVPFVRIVHNAYFSDHYPNPSTGHTGNPTYASPGMTKDQYTVDASGVVEGDLLLLIGTIDNGATDTWVLPPNFFQIDQRTFGTDGETFVVGYKIAGSSEPGGYGENYAGPLFSAAATVTLVAIGGAAQTAPDSTTSVTNNAVTPVPAVADPLTTTEPETMVMYVAGLDSSDFDTSTTFKIPMGYTQIAAFGDHGTSAFDWSAQMIATRVQSTPGSSGSASGEFDSPTGDAWSMLLAIKPAP